MSGTGATTAVFTACCQAKIVTTTINGTTWRECAECGQVVA